MDYDLICADGEFSSTINAINRYIDFLNGKIGECVDILNSINGESIRSAEFFAAVSSLEGLLASCSEQLDAQKTSIVSILKKEVQELEQTDCYDHPDTSMMDVIRLLAGFLS